MVDVLTIADALREARAVLRACKINRVRTEAIVGRKHSEVLTRPQFNTLKQRLVSDSIYHH